MSYSMMRMMASELVRSVCGTSGGVTKEEARKEGTWLVAYRANDFYLVRDVLDS